jgi:hypothetical protein
VATATGTLPVTGLALTGMLAAGLGSMAGGAGLMLADGGPGQLTIA